MADLRTNYQDDVLDASKNTARVYDLVDSNGTVVLAGVHLEDKTVYTTEGDDYGAADINEQNGKINELSNDLVDKDNLKLISDATKQIRFGTDSNGNYGYYKDGADSVTPFKHGATKVTSIAGNRTATRTVDCTSLSNYQSLTADNFILDIKQVVAYTDAAQGGNGTPAANISKSYNSSTGILTINGLVTAYNPTWYWNQYVYTSSFDVYCID